MADITIYDVPLAAVAHFRADSNGNYSGAVILGDGAHSLFAFQSVNGQSSAPSPKLNFVVGATSTSLNLEMPPRGTVPDEATSIVATMSSEKTNYHISEPITFGLSVMTRATGLSLTIGPGNEKFWISSNGAIIWQTENGIVGTDMMHTWHQPPGVALLSLTRGVPLFFNYTWDGRIVNSQGATVLPAPGKYELQGTVGGITALPVTVTIE